mmetsp:Transcript_41768/g.37198  ORF Transcript_41768/g.37198 Transcript_41768/m.37198 type:complete len:85 (+) Transcript_41768:410-664(+)
MLTSTPLFFDFRAPHVVNYGSFYTGAALAFIGIVGEAVSDSSLEEFKRKKIRGGILKSGLWKYSRHPNLFFELMAWTGFAIMGI